MDSPPVDIAIVAYRRWDLTRSCLTHLAAQTRAHKVYLCDNGCDEGTADRVRREFPRATVLRLHRNMSYAVACNRAVGAGDGELLITLNNDVDAHPDFVERLVTPLETDRRTGSVAALLVRPGDHAIDSAGLVADRTLAAFPRWHGCAPAQARADRPLLAGPAGAGAAFRRTAWEELKGLDETSFAYMEDFDLVIRLRTAGWSTALALDAVAVHVGAATHGHRSPSQRRSGGFGRGYLLRRYGVLRSRAALRAVATEAIVVLGDFAISRDAAALRGRVAGWRAAAREPRHPFPPPGVVDDRISFRDSIRLRRGVYSGKSVE